MNHRNPKILLLAAALCVAGCAGEKVPQLARVHGKVTFQGKPLTTGRVVFMPVKQGEGESRIYPASGDIKEDGSYELTTNNPGDGASIGEHKVIMEVFNAPGQGGAPAPGMTLKSIVPMKYTDPSTTPLTKTVAAGDNTIDLDILPD